MESERFLQSLTVEGLFLCVNRNRMTKLDVYDITGLLREIARGNLALLWSEAEKKEFIFL